MNVQYIPWENDDRTGPAGGEHVDFSLALRQGATKPLIQSGAFESQVSASHKQNNRLIGLPRGGPCTIVSPQRKTTAHNRGIK
jgi:hypothetical protein